MRRPPIGLVCALCALAFAAGAAPPSGAPASFEGFGGIWTRVRIGREDAAREAEIARVTESMPLLARGIARSWMARRMRPHDTLLISWSEGEFIVRAYERSQSTKGKRTGDVFELRPNGSIEQTWSVGTHGHGTTTWQLSPDGSHLFLEISVSNPNFEGPLKHATTYRHENAAQNSGPHTRSGPS